MGRLDVAGLRYMTREHFRVLHAVEVGMRNHQLVSAQLVSALANVRTGGVLKTLRQLQNNRLLAYERGRRYDGFRLTSLGYDYLALQALVSGGHVEAFGAQLGTGKESDVYAAFSGDGETLALKFHRLGRTSFRRLRVLRDYHAHRRHTSWLYVSSLSAAREVAFMRALHARGFPVPRPVERNRHAVLMSLVDGVPLCRLAGQAATQRQHSDEDSEEQEEEEEGEEQEKEDNEEPGEKDDGRYFQRHNLGHDEDPHQGPHQVSKEKATQLQEDEDLVLRPQDLYDQCMRLMVRLAECGVVHCDFNEFNLMVTAHLDVVLIDLPQMVSTSHPNARELFDRDVKCLQRFFARRFHFHSVYAPVFDEIVRSEDLDAEVRASGYAAEFGGDDVEESVSEDDEGSDDSDAEDGSGDSDRDCNVDATLSEVDSRFSRIQLNVIDDEANTRLSTNSKLSAVGESEVSIDLGTVDEARQEDESAPDANQDDDVDPEVDAERRREMKRHRQQLREQQRVAARAHVNELVAAAARQRCKQAESSVASSSCIEPEQLSRRLRQQHRKQQRSQVMKRARAKGEASATTRARRNNAADIRESTTGFWAGGY